MTPNRPPEPDRPAARRRAGQLETQIINVLTEADRPLTTGDVLKALGSEATLSYSTVVTTLNRLHTKGVATRRRHGRAFRYEAVADAAGLTAFKMSRLLREEHNRASALRRFVSTLDPGDEELLRDLLQQGQHPGQRNRED
ncbi:BlaI/MecI/CopY family transcriptional regulator [Spirillospora sp. CA-108201]